MQQAVCTLRARAAHPSCSSSVKFPRRLAPQIRRCRIAGASGRKQTRPAALIDFVDIVEPFVRLSESIADGSILQPASLRAIGVNALEAGGVYAVYSLAVRVKKQLDEQRLQVEAGGTPPPRKFLGVSWGGDDSDSEDEEGEESGEGGRAANETGLVFDVGLMSLIMWCFITGVLFYTGWFYDAFAVLTLGSSIFMLKLPVAIILGLVALMFMAAFELDSYGVEVLAMSLGTNVVGAFKRYSEGRKVTSAGPKTVRALSSAVITAAKASSGAAVH